MVDLRQRREGDVLGTSQSGRRSSLRLLSVLDHEELIVAARESASSVLATDPTLDSHPALRAALDEIRSEAATDYLEKA
jgi:ATP-dependent DNA helicase RecG